MFRTNQIIKGDCIEQLKLLEENSVDAIVTDPPYGLEFMGKDWDKFSKGELSNLWQQAGKPSMEKFDGHNDWHSKPRPRMIKELQDMKSMQEFVWSWATECLRVLKPGGFLLSFGGTRTYHRLVCGIEDAGFEIRDTIMWLYGSGFPKSLNIGKQIDKMGNGKFIEFGKMIIEHRNKKGLSMRDIAKHFPSRTGGLTGCVWNWEKGNNVPTLKQYNKLIEILEIPLEKAKEFERDIVGTTITNKTVYQKIGERNTSGEIDITKGNSEWEGWGTALKPACEPICVARKPLSEKNVALNVLKWGTGGINIDDCRIGNEIRINKGMSAKQPECAGTFRDDNWIPKEVENIAQGRFPANIILDEEAGKMLDEQSGESKSSSGKCKAVMTENNRWKEGKGIATPGHKVIWEGKGDKGGASRFFYCAKSSKAERNKGTDSFINVEVLKVICEENNLIKEERLAKLSVDMGVFQGKDIEESGIQQKEDSKWNTLLFGKNITEKYQKDIQSIIKTETNSITPSKILNWLKHLLINEYTLDANLLMGNGGNHVENVEKSKELIITINEKLALALGVKNVASGMQLKIKLSEGKCDHPTVKPIKLMEYLIKLVSCKGAIVLDPFLGSGTTAIACLKLNRNFIGIEKEEEYVKIAEARIKPYLEQRKL